jgi:hypothetical protein
MLGWCLGHGRCHMLLYLFLAANAAMAQDADNDGFTPPEDCDDTDPDIHPAAEEICDGEDNNCDNETDEGLLRTYWPDSDGDGYGEAGAGIQSCSMPPGHVLNSQDCDDGDMDLSPAAEETCDGADNNCNNVIDEGCGEEGEEEEEELEWSDTGEADEDSGEELLGDTGSTEAENSEDTGDTENKPKTSIETEIGGNGCDESAWIVLPMALGICRRRR